MAVEGFADEMTADVTKDDPAAESVAGDVAPGSRKLLGCDQRWWMM